MINVTVPDMKVPFINPVAAFCCAIAKIKEFGNMINDEVIQPFVDGVKSLWDSIVSGIQNMRLLLNLYGMELYIYGKVLNISQRTGCLWT